MLPLEPHIILKNNAMFLLDLASASGFQLPAQAQKKASPSHDLFLPSVVEEYRQDMNPFPQVPFQFLIRQSAQSSDSAFADEFYIDADERVRSGSMSMRRPVHSISLRPRMPTEPRHSPLARSGSLGKDQRPLSTCIPPTSPLVITLLHKHDFIKIQKLENSTKLELDPWKFCRCLVNSNLVVVLCLG
jgi:hypothetical protein